MKDIIFEENIENEETDLQVDKEKFGQAVIWGTDWTTETIARQLEKGTINLNPSFQRRDAWSNREKSKLIESLILGLPVPPIILAENKEKKNSYIVIDGKQRLLSIRRFFSNDDDSEKSFKKLRLSGLEILSDLNGMTYTDIERVENDYIANLENQSIRTIVIKNWPDESFLYTVFLRLNTGSKKLSSQELRQALKPGAFLNYLDDATAKSTAIMKMLNNKTADSRMKDIELALRYFAFKFNLESYKGNLKNFLDDTCEKLNKRWEYDNELLENEFEQLEKAIEFSYDIMETNSPFSRYNKGISNNRFNRCIFELFSFYFSNKDIREMVLRNKKEFVEAFIALNDDNEFISAISDSAKETKRVCTRFSKFVNLLNDIRIKLTCKTELKLLTIKGDGIGVEIIS